MEKHLFFITFTLNCFVLLLSFTGVISAPVIQVITDVMKNDTKCNASKFLYDSKYTCSSLEYPTDLSDLSPRTVDNFLCLGVYDAAYKICQYSSRQISFNSTSFNLYIDNLVPGDNEEQFEEDSQQEFCKNLAGLTLLYNKTSLYLAKLIKNLNNLDKCQKICFDFNNNLHPSCAVLGWIKSVENNMKKPDHNSITPTQSVGQSHNELLKHKNSRIKISKEKDEEQRKQTTTDFKDNNNNKKVKQNMSDSISNTNIKFSEKETFTPKESIKTQKIVDNTATKAGTEKNEKFDKSGTNEAAQFSKNMPSNNEVSSKKNVGNYVPNKADPNEEKSEDLKTKQNINDVKTTTLSENTQDHYDMNVGDGDEMETGDMNDVDETVQQPNMEGNQNEEIHVQETFEKNNLRFSNLRTEDDSHFFTYFTVIAMMCIIGYIGYCNKQKIFAIVLEGRRSKNNRGRRRPSTASYRKLDCTLEEAVTSQCNANVTHVIY